MKNVKWITASIAVMIFAACGAVLAEEKILFDFENEIGGWVVPEWCFEKKDYICKTAVVSKEFASHGASSLALDVDFAGPAWKAAVVECEECELDLSQYRKISCDFYVPKNVSHGIIGKIILTVQENGDWKWSQTQQGVDLIPGQWVTLTASLEPHNRDWVRFMGNIPAGGNPNDPKIAGAYVIDSTESFRASVKKVTIRVEADKAAYKGYVYIDNIRAE